VDNYNIKIDIDLLINKRVLFIKQLIVYGFEKLILLHLIYAYLYQFYQR
jgi:hypothetical protein